MLCLKRVTKKTAGLLLVTAIAVSMITPATVFAFDDAAVVIDATRDDVEEHIKEDVHTEEDYQNAVDVRADNGHVAEITTKNVEAEDGTGISVNAFESASASVTVNGNATGHSYYPGAGASVGSLLDGSVQLSVTGNVSGEYRGAEIFAQEGGTVSFDAANVVGTGEDSCGLDLTVNEVNNPGDANKAASAAIVVSNDVIGATYGARVGNSGGFAEVLVGGSVSALDDDNNGEGFLAQTFEDGFSNIYIGENVMCSNVGIEVIAASGGTNNIVVEGTVYGGKAGIIAIDDSEGKNVITVWKVETDKDGFIAGSFYDDSVEDKEAEKNIQYIIKVQSTDGATLVATDENGKALAKVDAANGKSYEYAYQGDKVLLKIDVDGDYSLDAVYGDDGKQYKLGKDDKGNYYIIVPAGGGVQFSAVLSKKEKDKDDEKKDETPVSNNAQTVTIPTAAAVAQAAVQAAVQSISSTPAGGTANVAVADTTIDASVVKSLLARRDVNVALACFVNGKLCTIMIPAGADLSDIINPDGTIAIEKLAKKFGKTEVQ